MEVVSLCDVDKQLLKEAADMVSTRQKSGKRPRTYADYREMLANKDLDIVLIATPDHWHALNMIEAVKAGADVYVQKPISVDIREGQAMLQAARQYGRVVQVGTQRRSMPHLIDAKKRFIDTGALGKIAHAEICCYYHMRNRSNPPNEAPPSHLDYDMWTGPSPAASLQQHRSSTRLAVLYGIWQWDCRRHVYPHVGHRKMDAGLGMADSGVLFRRDSGGQSGQGKHFGHPDSHL